MRREQRSIDLDGDGGVSGREYLVRVECVNCGWEGQVGILKGVVAPFGSSLAGAICEECECESLHRSCKRVDGLLNGQAVARDLPEGGLDRRGWWYTAGIDGSGVPVEGPPDPPAPNTAWATDGARAFAAATPGRVSIGDGETNPQDVGYAVPANGLYREASPGESYDISPGEPYDGAPYMMPMTDQQHPYMVPMTDRQEAVSYNNIIRSGRGYAAAFRNHWGAWGSYTEPVLHRNSHWLTQGMGWGEHSELLEIPERVQKPEKRAIAPEQLDLISRLRAAGILSRETSLGQFGFDPPNVFETYNRELTRVRFETIAMEVIRRQK